MGDGSSLTEDEAEERALLAAVRSGDERAFERLVARHAPSVFRIVAGHLGPTDAEDAAQEVFTRVYLGLKGYKGEARLSTWIFRVATNVALTRASKKRRRDPVRPFEEEPPSSAPPPGEELLAQERREAVRRAVEQLPEEQRSVVLLRSEGLSFEEVARVLGILRPTAESRMARAKERLRAILERFMSGDESKNTDQRERD